MYALTFIPYAIDNRKAMHGIYNGLGQVHRTHFVLGRGIIRRSNTQKKSFIFTLLVPSQFLPFIIIFTTFAHVLHQKNKEKINVFYLFAIEVTITFRYTHKHTSLKGSAI